MDTRVVFMTFPAGGRKAELRRTPGAADAALFVGGRAHPVENMRVSGGGVRFGALFAADHFVTQSAAESLHDAGVPFRAAM